MDRVKVMAIHWVSVISMVMVRGLARFMANSTLCSGNRWYRRTG